MKTYQPSIQFTPWSLDLFIRVPFQLHGGHKIVDVGYMLGTAQFSSAEDVVSFAWNAFCKTNIVIYRMCFIN